MNEEATMSSPLERPVGRLAGIVPAAIRAQKIMDRAAMLSDIALDAAADGRGREANTISAEAARCRREAKSLLEPYMTPNTY